MIPEIKFDNTNEPLYVEFKVKDGVIAASYIISLFEANSNDTLKEFKGNNVNDQDDKYILPEPPKDNNERVLSLDSSFYGLDPERSRVYDIRMIVYQGSTIIGETISAGDIKRNKTDSILSFLKLKMKV
jgi:hypothetical protein